MESIADAVPLDSSQASARLTTRVWRQWPALLLSLATLILYQSVLVGLVRQWSADPNYSHGFLVPVLTGYLIWRKRNEMAATPLCYSAMGTAFIALSLGLLFLGTLGAELFLQRISLWLMIVGLFLYFLGWSRLRVVAFPIAFLLFMIPLPAIIYNQVVFPLQLLTSHLATSCLHLTNAVPIAREGNLLVLPNSTLEITEACSGIRSLISLLAFSLGYGHLAETNLSMRILLGLAAIPLAIVSNAARLIITAVLVYYISPRAAEGLPHAMSSYVIVITAALLLLVVHALLTWSQRRLATARRNRS